MRSISLSRVIIPFLLVSALSLLGGLGVVQFNADFRYLLFLALLVAVFAIVALGGRKALQFGFVVWIWAIILGYRTIHLTSSFSLHPLMIILALLFVNLLFLLKSEQGTRLRLPRLLWVFGAFWLWGFIPGIMRGLSWSDMLSEALNFFLLIPLFMIILYLSKEPGFWKSATLTFLGAGSVIALLGTLEFYSPQFRSFLPGLIETNMEGLASTSGQFIRASYAIFGTALAVIISALSLPMIALVYKFYRGKMAVFFGLVLFAILAVGIYISGTRNAWLMTFVAILLLAYFSIGWVGLVVTAVLGGILYRFLPAGVGNLMFSLTTPLATGQVLDSSLQVRIGRQQDAFALLLQNPLGLGWSGAG